MNCSAAERDILLYNYCRSSVVVVQMRFKINCSPLSLLLCRSCTLTFEDFNQRKKKKKKTKKTKKKTKKKRLLRLK
jgi:hypothetical protein